jgi:transcription antitermination factor NusG
MNLGSDFRGWYALQVRTRWEASTSVLLSGKGYETLLPTYKTKKNWSGKLREVNAPLFPGYVFCRFNVQNRLPVLVTPGVISVVGRGRVPMPVEDGEIAAIQTLVSSGFSRHRSLTWKSAKVGLRNALWGLEGIQLISRQSSHRSLGFTASPVHCSGDRSVLCDTGRASWTDRAGDDFFSSLAAGSDCLN